MRDLPSNTKPIKIDKLERHEVEKNLTLLGLIVFENRIKRETKPVIEKLHRAKVRTIMVTGDHIQTALSVARSVIFEMLDLPQILKIPLVLPAGLQEMNRNFKFSRI